MPRIKAANLEEHHEQVWQDLTQAMSELLAERDYESINLGQIAARAGLARNTLYNYAQDKASLAAAVAERVGRPLVVQVVAVAEQSRPAAERLREMIHLLIEAFTSNTVRLILHPAPSAPPRQEVLEHIKKPFAIVIAAVENVVRDGIESGEFRELDDVPLTVSLLGGVVRTGTERMVHESLDPEHVTRTVQDIVLEALADRGAEPRRTTQPQRKPPKG